MAKGELMHFENYWNRPLDYSDWRKDSEITDALNRGEWDSKKVDRGTKCFSPRNNGYPGGYPMGFLDWIIDAGWWGDVRMHVPCGMVADVGPGEVVRVDIHAPPVTNATHVFDCLDSSGWADAFGGEHLERFDFVAIDPPYSHELAERLYDTGETFGSIDRFVKKAAPAVKKGGLLLTLSYQVPKRPGPDFDLLACWGIYQTISVSHMRCMQVWRRRGNQSPRGLDSYGA